MYICKVEFSDVSLSTSDWTLCTRATSAKDARLATAYTDIQEASTL